MLKLEYLSGSDEQDNEFFIQKSGLFINHRYIKSSLKPVTIQYLTYSKKISHQAGPYLVMSEEACSPNSMIYTRGCNYSFMYS